MSLEFCARIKFAFLALEHMRILRVSNDCIGGDEENESLVFSARLIDEEGIVLEFKHRL